MTKTTKISTAVKLLIDEFLNDYEEVSYELSAAEKTNLSYFSGQFFSKWYYSTLLNDTFLSPANIISEIYKKNGTFFSLGFSHTENNHHFNFSLYEENADFSVFISDLKKICDFCTPYGSLFPKKQSWFMSANDIRLKLHFDDPYYMEYLMETAIHLKLISPMHSIGTVMYQTDEKKSSAFFGHDTISCLKIIFETALDIFYIKLIDELMLPENAICADELKAFLKKSHNIDDLMSTIYSNMSFNFETISEYAKKDNLTEDEESLVASAVFLSSSLGKWLFTPLGTYIHLINPLYAAVFDFETELDYLRPCMHLDCDLTTELFSCCNYFTLTPFGSAVLECESENIFAPDDGKKLTLRRIREIVDASGFFKLMLSSTRYDMNSCTHVYRFKVFFKKDAEMWKTFEIPSDSTLADLAKAVDTFIGIFDNSDYIFSYKDINYVAMGNKKGFIKAEKTLIDTLGFEKKSRILYSNPYNKEDDLIIELVHYGEATKSSNYPLLLKQSQKITESEKEDF